MLLLVLLVLLLLGLLVLVLLAARRRRSRSCRPSNLCPSSGWAQTLVLLLLLVVAGLGSGCPTSGTSTSCTWLAMEDHLLRLKVALSVEGTGNHLPFCKVPCKPALISDLQAFIDCGAFDVKGDEGPAEVSSGKQWQDGAQCLKEGGHYVGEKGGQEHRLLLGRGGLFFPVARATRGSSWPCTGTQPGLLSVQKACCMISLFILSPAPCLQGFPFTELAPFQESWLMNRGGVLTSPAGSFCRPHR